jgi:predicted small integral membrane protein
MEGNHSTNHNLPILTQTEDLQRLLLKAQEGDRSILPQLKAALDANPDLWQQVGDLAQHAELTMLHLVAGNDLFAREAIQRKVAELKAEWTNPSPAPLEKLLVDRVAVCWLQLHYLDVDAFQTLAQDPGKTPASVYAQRRLDSAQRRYLQAIRALAGPEIHTAFYIGIITWESIIALLMGIGALRMLIALKADKVCWERSKRWGEGGLALGLLLWYLAFLVVGGEWFGMWQSTIWNGTSAALRMFTIQGLILLYLHQPEATLPPTNAL